MTETKLLTNMREIEDLEVLNKRRHLVESRSPAQLSEFNGIADFPIPTTIEKLFKPKNDNMSLHSENIQPKNFSESMYATLPKSWKEQNLITSQKTETDPEILAARRALTQQKTPAELASITSFSDMPIPTALENFLKSEHKNASPRKPISE